MRNIKSAEQVKDTLNLFFRNAGYQFQPTFISFSLNTCVIVCLNYHLYSYLCDDLPKNLYLLLFLVCTITNTLIYSVLGKALYK